MITNHMITSYEIYRTLILDNTPNIEYNVK